MELSKEERRALAVKKLAKAFNRNDVLRSNDSNEKATLTRILAASTAEVSSLMVQHTILSHKYNTHCFNRMALKLQLND